MIRRAAALCITVCAVPVAAQQFEGTVSMTLTPESGTVRSISYMLKGGKMRFDPGGGQISVVIDPGAQRIMLIMNAQRMYTETSFSGVAAATQSQMATGNPTVVRTGKFDTIAGYKCEHVTVPDDDGATVDSCMSSELGGFRLPAASNPISPQKEAGWLAQLGSHAFPLKVEKGGKVILLVTAIEKKPLDAALFAAPEGYQSFAMPGRKPHNNRE